MPSLGTTDITPKLPIMKLVLELCSLKISHLRGRRGGGGEGDRGKNPENVKGGLVGVTSSPLPLDPPLITYITSCIFVCLGLSILITLPQ